MIHAEVVLKDQTEMFFQIYEHAAVERIVTQLVTILKSERPDIMQPSRHAAKEQWGRCGSDADFTEEFFLLDAFTNKKLDPKKSLADQKIDSGCRLRLVWAAQNHSGRNEEV